MIEGLPPNIGQGHILNLDNKIECPRCHNNQFMISPLVEIHKGEKINGADVGITIVAEDATAFMCVKCASIMVLRGLRMQIT